MNSEHREIASKHQDPELAARIIRDIEQIEDDSHLAYGPISHRLMTETGSSARSAVPDNWLFEATDDSLMAMAPEWKANRGVNQRDAWFELSDLIADEERDHSWVAVLVSKGNTQLILELKFRPGLVPVVEALTDKDPVIVNVVKAGFKRHPETKRLYVPIELDAGLMAKGCIENDLHAALEPLRHVVGRAVSVRAPIDSMLEHVRAEAKKR